MALYKLYLSRSSLRTSKYYIINLKTMISPCKQFKVDLDLLLNTIVFI